MIDNFKKSLLLILFVFICLFLFVKFAGPIPFFVNSVATNKTNLFQADGTGTAAAVPDEAQISFGVTKSAPTITDAQNQTNTAIQSVLDALKSEGISDKDIQTTNYSVNPQYNQTSQQIQGYTVTQNITVKLTKLDMVNKTIDTLTSKGANIVGQVSFTFSDDLQAKLESQARQMAVSKAKQKASSLANAAGIHLGNIVDVQENNNVPGPRPFALDALKAAGSAEAAPTTVTPGENTVSLTVTLSYEIY